MSPRVGRHFLQLPGPSNVPDRILQALARSTIDHRGPEFAAMTKRILDGLGRVFATEHEVFLYPSSASGAWEAALVNTLEPGDRVLLLANGFFAEKWGRVAGEMGFEVETLEGDWRRPPDPGAVEERLRGDAQETIRAVLLVHSETSTGIRADVAAVGEAIRGAGHPALFMVDAVSSLASIEFRHDAWGVDVTVAGSQKGLMLPPGLAFTAASPRAAEAAAASSHPRSYWDWEAMRERNRDGFFPYTPATNLLFGLEEALAMLQEEGLEEVWARHERFARATRRAVRAWGLETVCIVKGAHSATVTSVPVPEGADADAFRAHLLERYDVTLGKGLGRLEGRAFRIGHLGELNAPWLLGALAAVEMGLEDVGIAHEPGGLQAALTSLREAGSGAGVDGSRDEEERSG